MGSDETVYRTSVNTFEEIIDRIQNTAAGIRANTDMISRTQESLSRRAKACIRNGGRHFEDLL